VRHDRALPVAIHGMMPARAERGDGSEEKSPWHWVGRSAHCEQVGHCIPHGDVTKGDARQIPAPRYHVAVERVLQQRVYLNLRGVKRACW